MTAAPILPAGISQPNAFPGTRNNINTTPNAAPELIPNTSGLAIGLPVRRWIIQPATASMTPAISAEKIRGQRHCMSSCSKSPVAQCQPVASRPSESAANEAITSTASPARLNHTTD